MVLISGYLGSIIACLSFWYTIITLSLWQELQDIITDVNIVKDLQIVVAIVHVFTAALEFLNLELQLWT